MSETVIRAFELPVHRVEPVNERDGWELLRECWQQATYLANWGVQQLQCADVVRMPGMTERPKPPAVRGKKLKGLYGLASETFSFKTGWWAGACISASTILREVESKYREERSAVMWFRSRGPSYYRYPKPWPVHAQAWTQAGFDQAGKPYIVCALPGGLVKITLRGGPEFGRQLGLFRQVVDGQLPRIQLVIRQQPASLGCHRPTMRDGGKPSRVMVKMVARLPAREKPGDRVLVLATDPHSFWVAELDGQPAWVLNNDHFRQGVARHETHLRRLQRIAQDAKAERRLTGNRYRSAQAKLEASCLKDKRRLDSWTHETAAHLVGYALRQRVGIVLYLDRDQGFITKFPWHQLHSKLSDKLKAAGIEFYSESALKLSGANPVAEYDGATVGLQPTREDEKWERIARLREAATRKVVAVKRRKGSHPAVSRA